MRAAGTELLSCWREAGEWWNSDSYREYKRFIDPKGIRRETHEERTSVGLLGTSGQRALEERHNEEWCIRERKIRDEKVSAACGKHPTRYYERAAEERRGYMYASKREGSQVFDPNPERLKDAVDNAGWAVFVREQVQGQESIREFPKDLVRIAHGAYAPLHVYSGYAFGRSTLLAEEIAAYASMLGCPAVAIADPHSLVGCVEFVKACSHSGIKPLVGASIELPEGGYLVLIARNKTGYRSLSRLISQCHLGEPRQFPLGSWERIELHSEGLLCLTGGDLGPLDSLLVQRDMAGAEALMRRLVSIYGRENTFIEVERSFLPWQIRVNRLQLELCEHLGIRAVAGGVVTHPTPAQYPAQDVLVCSDTLCLIEEVIGRKPRRHESQPQVRSAPERGLNAERYMHSPQEMGQVFSDCPELLRNTLLIADMCEADVLPSRTKLPKLYEDDNAALWHIVDANARGVYPKLTPAIQKRLDKETSRISQLGFASYFLAAADICRWAGEQGIQLSGRGSVVDSAVAYVLGLSRIDAIEHNLHFDRFLPADGSKRPDIDIDFEAHRRDDVRGYVVRRYGVEHTATVAAIGAYCTRGIVREVGKVFGLRDETIKFLAGRIHGGISPDQLESALSLRPELRDSNIPRERFSWVLRLAKELMDLPRNIRCHSSGVVISEQPICDTVPTMWSASGCSDESGAADPHLRIIQWDKRSCKGYFDKFDILCLRGQDVMSGVQKHIRKISPEFKADRVPTDDPESYRAMRSGELIGIPQSASPAMRQAHIRLQTEHLTDASVIQAGIRPGVGGSVKLNQLIRRRRGFEAFTYSHPDLEEILGHTYGIIVFQEQVDQLLQKFAGCTAGQAEDIRDAIYKRRRENFSDMVREKIVERILSNNYPLTVAHEVYELVAAFKGYGFAQGHALAFAELSVRSIYLMQNHPSEYFASLLSAQPAGYYGPCTIANEARSRGVQILHPDVNRSVDEFSVEDAVVEGTHLSVPNGAIRTGLMQVGGLSTNTKQRILECHSYAVADVGSRQLQPMKSVSRDGKVAVAVAVGDQGQASGHREESPRAFRSFFSFVNAVKPERDELEALILCGAFDDICPNRRALLWAIPSAYEYLSATRSDGGHPQLPLSMPEPQIDLSIKDFDMQERAVYERAVLGMDIDRHLMTFERRHVTAHRCVTSDEAKRLPIGTKAAVVGNPIRLRFPPTPSGKRVVFFDLEDETGLLNVTCFDAIYQRDGKAIVTCPYVTIVGETQDREGHTAFLASRVFPYKPMLLRGKSEKLPITTADFLCG